jgi:hypothetical protein
VEPVGSHPPGPCLPSRSHRLLQVPQLREMRIEAGETTASRIHIHMARPRFLPPVQLPTPHLGRGPDHPYPAFQTNGRRIASGVTCIGLQAFPRCQALSTRGELWHPAIRKTRHALNDGLGAVARRGSASSPHPDRNGTLHGQRVEPGMTHPVPPAHKIHDWLGPQRPENGNLLLAAPPPIVKIFVEGFKLHRIPPNSHSQAKAAPADEIDLRRLLGDQRRLTLGKNKYARDEFKRRRTRGEIPQHDERFMKGVLMAVRSPRERRVLGMIGAQDMIGHHEVVKTEPFNRLDKIPDGNRIARNFTLGEGDTHLHTHDPLHMYHTDDEF